MLDITPENLDTFFVPGPYLVHIDGRQVAADPRDKGEPGDIVVVWPKRRPPRLLRRLARCQPFDRYFFSEPDTGATTAVPCNKVSAIHKVVEVHERMAGRAS